MSYLAFMRNLRYSYYYPSFLPWRYATTATHQVPSCDRTEESLGCSQLSPSSPSPPLIVGDEQMAEEISHPSPLEEINLNTGRQSGPR